MAGLEESFLGGGQSIDIKVVKNQAKGPKIYQIGKIFPYLLRGGFKKKKTWKSGVFCQTGGGGSPEVVKKPNCFFETEFFSESI